jgi:hypothetical protein
MIPSGPISGVPGLPFYEFVGSVCPDYWKKEKVDKKVTP